MDLALKFSVVKEMSTAEAQNIFGEFLRKEESILRAYTHTRDKVVFTDRQLICYDVQGITGSKKEFRFFPYSKITSFSVETAGTFDGDADFKIWMSGVGMFEIKFAKSLDVKKIGIFLAKTIG
tara:strand:+ start:4980 stop:5348 length:369 start_codon:yes stop_codon:yes gene_type:complete